MEHPVTVVGHGKPCKRPRETQKKGFFSLSWQILPRFPSQTKNYTYRIWNFIAMNLYRRTGLQEQRW